MVKTQLVQEELEGQSYWFSPSLPVSKIKAAATHLLPGFDQYLLSYRERGAVLDPAYAKKVVPGGNGMFKPVIVIDGRIVGLWQRTLRKTKVLMTFHPFEPLSPSQLDAAIAATEPYGHFLGLPVEISD